MVQTANLREDLLLSVVVHSADIHDNTGSLHARPPDGNLYQPTAVRQLSKQIQLVRIFVVEGLQRPVTKQLV